MIVVDPANMRGLIQIMDAHGNSEYPFIGENENGEKVVISVCSDSITVNTYQHNGWCRTNIYHRDGYDEELYERGAV